MPVVDELVTKYTLQAPGYASQARNITSSTLGLGAAARTAGLGFMSLGNSIRYYGGAGAGLVLRARGLIAVLAALQAGVIALGVVAAHKAADFDALVRALEAIEGSADAAAAAIKDLREIARGPGLGFREAIQGYSQFRRAGLTSGFSKAMLAELGNVIALSGGGKADMAQVSRVIMQMATKPFLQGEELLQLAEAGIPAHRMIKDIYGTSDTEELKKRGVSGTQVLEDLLASFKKMPRVVGGAKNAFENLADAIDIAFISVGSQLNLYLKPVIDEITKAIELFGNSGVATGVVSHVFEKLNTEARGLESTMTGVIVAFMMVTDAVERFVLNAKGAFENWKKFTPLGWLTSRFTDTPEAPGMGAVPTPSTAERYGNQVRLEMDLARKKMERAQKEAAAKPAEGPAGTVEQKQLQELTKIAKSTEAQLQLELGRYALGGGDLGRMGVTPVELNRMRGKGGGIQINAPSGPFIISNAGAYISDVILQLQRAGALRT